MFFFLVSDLNVLQNCKAIVTLNRFSKQTHIKCKRLNYKLFSFYECEISYCQTLTSSFPIFILQLSGDMFARLNMNRVVPRCGLISLVSDL